MAAVPVKIAAGALARTVVVGLGVVLVVVVAVELAGATVAANPV